MRASRWVLGLAAIAALAVGGAAVVGDSPLFAADHVDPPARTDPAVVGATADVAGDIADIFFFHGNGTVKIILTNAGPRAAGLPPVYDRNVTYVIHLSNDGNALTDEFVIEARYGRDPAGNWGIQLTGVPGTTAPIVGPVQTPLAAGAVRAIAGLFDDPFFFDSEGFRDTRASGTLMIRNDRNFFGFKNDTSIVIEVPRTAVERGTNPLHIWAEARRIAGS